MYDPRNLPVRVHNPNELPAPHTPTQSNIIEWIVEHLKWLLQPISFIARGSLLTLVGMLLIMWLINLVYHPLNFIPAIIGLLAIAGVLTSSTVLAHSIPIGAIFTFLKDRDVSQGIANTPGNLAKVGLIYLHVFSMSSVVLATYSFGEAPFAFWGLLLVIVAFTTLGLVYGKRGNWSRRLQLLYLTGAFLALLWSTFGISLNYNLPEEVSDENGAAVVMYNPVTKEIVPDLSPADCTETKPCYAKDGVGVKLEPLTTEEANWRNPKVGVVKLLELTGSPWFWLGAILLAITIGAFVVYSRSYMRSTRKATAQIGGGAGILLVALLVFSIFGGPAAVSAASVSVDRTGSAALEICDDVVVVTTDKIAEGMQVNFGKDCMLMFNQNEVPEGVYLENLTPEVDFCEATRWATDAEYPAQEFWSALLVPRPDGFGDQDEMNFRVRLNTDRPNPCS